MWLLIGVLFRLPKLAEMPQPVPIPKHLRGVPRWRLALIGENRRRVRHCRDCDYSR